MKVHRFHGRLGHLLALAAPRVRLRLRLLAIMLPEAGIHVALNVSGVRQNVVHHPLLQRPPEEVQLAHRRLLNRGMPADLECDAFTATEWIKQTLGIGLQLTFILEMNHERAGSITLWLVDRIRHVELFGVVRDKPVDET